MVLDTDTRFCADLLPQVSRTFALSIETLPEALREYVRVAYLLCRILDTIEDAPGLELLEREALFDEFNALLRSPERKVGAFEGAFKGMEGASQSPDLLLCVGAGAVFRRYFSFSEEVRACLEGPILEMSEGMRSYVRRFVEAGQHRIFSVSDLEKYCYFVAGTVGELLTNLFLWHCPVPEGKAAELHERKVSFGLGLQMVNILKDIADDLNRGACFLPLDLLGEVGVAPEDVLLPENRGRVMGVLGTLVHRAEQHLNAAKEYILCWPKTEGYSIRVFTIVPFVLALATLAMIRDGGEQVLRAGENPKVSRELVATLLAGADGAARDDAELEGLILRTLEHAAL